MLRLSDAIELRVFDPTPSPSARSLLSLTQLRSAVSITARSKSAYESEAGIHIAYGKVYLFLHQARTFFSLLHAHVLPSLRTTANYRATPFLLPCFY